MKSIIEINNVSKKYRIRDNRPYYSLRDTLVDFIKNPLNLLVNDKNEFWALKNISFDVKPGEAVGIIGKNGAGKSTLLKILSQITPPTKGQIKLGGRTASLLEVGTGFHPELSGRENIYLNGAILGMKKFEINLKFNQIVEFAEIAEFLDMAVKHYSSGMFMRLAFAVAVHLNPEILLIDEVLSVGDAGFQQKCLSKMQQITSSGKTILFVSHNLSAIISLCKKVVLIHKGKIEKIGTPEEVVSTYLQKNYKITPFINSSDNKLISGNIVKLIDLKVKNKNSQTLESFDIRGPIGIEIKYMIRLKSAFLTCNIQLTNHQGIIIFNSPENIDQKWAKIPKKYGINISTCWIPGNFLAEGLFSVRVTLSGYSPNAQFFELDYPDAVIFNVHDKLEGNSVRGKNVGYFPGVVRPKLKWITRHLLASNS